MNSCRNAASRRAAFTASGSRKGSEKEAEKPTGKLYPKTDRTQTGKPAPKWEALPEIRKAANRSRKSENAENDAAAAPQQAENSRSR